MNAFVDATDSSLPQFKKTPQVSSLASVLMTLLTTLMRLSPQSLAFLKGIRRSMVSPDWETLKKPPLAMPFSSLSVISEAIRAWTKSKQPRSRIRYSAYCPA